MGPLAFDTTRRMPRRNSTRNLALAALFGVLAASCAQLRTAFAPTGGFAPLSCRLAQQDTEPKLHIRRSGSVFEVSLREYAVQFQTSQCEEKDFRTPDGFLRCKSEQGTFTHTGRSGAAENWSYRDLKFSMKRVSQSGGNFSGFSVELTGTGFPPQQASEPIGYLLNALASLKADRKGRVPIKLCTLEGEPAF